MKATQRRCYPISAQSVTRDRENGLLAHASPALATQSPHVRHTEVSGLGCSIPGSSGSTFQSKLTTTAASWR